MKKIESVYDVATLLGSLDSRRWREVHVALEAGGSGYAFAPEVDFGRPPEIPELASDLFQEAMQIAEMNRLLRQAARSLHGNIGEALTHIRRAQRNIGELRDLGGAEFMDGDGDSDVEQFLKDAARLLRAAQELKGTDETGEMK
jgi:hypothetical protein